jgi:hypothetical protein
MASMLKTSNPSTASTNTEQLLLGLVASLKMLLVALALVIVIIALFAKSLLSFAVVLLTSCNLFATWMISLVASAPEVQSFAASFLATATR